MPFSLPFFRVSYFHVIYIVCLLFHTSLVFHLFPFVARGLMCWCCCECRRCKDGAHGRGQRVEPRGGRDLQ